MGIFPYLHLWLLSKWRVKYKLKINKDIYLNGINGNEKEDVLVNNITGKAE